MLIFFLPIKKPNNATLYELSFKFIIEKDCRKPKRKKFEVYAVFVAIASHKEKQSLKQTYMFNLTQLNPI